MSSEVPRFEQFSRNEQIPHVAAFLLAALAMGLLMMPAAVAADATLVVLTALWFTLPAVVRPRATP